MCQIASASFLESFDLGDLGAALAAQAALGVLVALGVERVLAGVHGGLEQAPAQIARSVLGDRAAAVAGGSVRSSV
jgi:hypothetical protein